MIEKKLQRSACAQRSAGLIEIAADIGHGTRRVIGCRFHKYRNPERSVAFIIHLLIIGIVFRAGFFNGTINIFFRHIFLLRRLYQHTKTWIIFRLRTTGLNGDGDFFSQLREYAGHISPTFKFPRLAELKCSSHSLYPFF